MFSLKNILLPVSIIATLLILLTYLLLPNILFRRYIKPTLNHLSTQDAKFFPKLKADQASFAGSYLTLKSSASSDAGPFLNPRVSWNGPHAKEPLLKDLHLAADLTAEIDAWKDTWMEHADDKRLVTLDFSWMRNLHRFDHWDIHKTCTGCIDSGIETLDVFSYRVPNYKNLRHWAKLRLLKGLKDKDLWQAARDVRQLARLLVSQEVLISAIASQGFYKLELSIFDFAKKQRLTTPAEWQPLSKETLDKSFRVCATVSRLFTPLGSQEVFDAIFKSKEHFYCKCNGMAEGMTLGILLGAKARKVYPTRFSSLTAVIEQTPECRLTKLRSMWQRQAPNVPEGYESEITRYQWLPRRFQAIAYGVIAVNFAGNPWGKYEE